MSIEQARNDLARMESERDMLTARLRELDVQVVKIANYIELAAVYGGTRSAHTESAVAHRSTTSAQQPSEGPKLPINVREARKILLERQRPTHTKILVEELARRSIRIGGTNPITNLSSALSRFKDTFTSDRSEGWSLVDWGKKADASLLQEPEATEFDEQQEVLGEDNKPLGKHELQQLGEFEAERDLAIEPSEA